MTAPLLWKQPLHHAPDFQMALNEYGGEVGHINYLGGHWSACYMGQRTLHLNQTDARAWVECQAQAGFTPQVSPDPEDTPLWMTVFFIIAAISLVVLFTGCAALRCAAPGTAPLPVLGQEDPEVLRVQRPGVADSNHPEGEAVNIARTVVTSTNERGHREISFEIRPGLFARLLRRQRTNRTITLISPWYQYTWYDKAHYHEVSPRMQIQCERVWTQHWRGL